MALLKISDIRARARAAKDQTTDLDNVKSFSAEGKDFRGLNKTVRVPFPKPKIRPMDATTFPGSTPDNGKIRESTQLPDVDHDWRAGHQPEPKPVLPGKPINKLDNSLRGLRRRRKNANGAALLMPQAEAYVAPNTGNNNYAQTLPVPAGAKKTNMKKKLSKSTLATSQYESDVIMSLSDLDSIFEEFKVGEKKEDVDGNNEAKKVRGTNAKGPGTGKVKRKYLGKSRGTTATGKPAHVIITEPVIGAQDKNWNKTTPSGDRKK